MAEFDPAVENVLRWEGGYVNDPRDPGGETKFGISKRSYPDVDIRGLTEEYARFIYRRDWWDRYRYGNIEFQPVADKVLSLAVNMGPKAAHRCLQRALRSVERPVTIDGTIGPETFEATNSASHCLLAALRSEAAGHYRTLIARRPGLRVYERGWMRRAYE